MAYDVKTKMEIKKRVVEGEAFKVIAKDYNNKPTPQQISNWANKKDPKTGLTWLDEAYEYETDQYESLSGKNQANKIMKKIDRIISKSDKSFTTKDADALAKLQRLMERVIDRKFQLPTMLYFAKRRLEFLKAHYKELVSEELINAERHFSKEMQEEFK